MIKSLDLKLINFQLTIQSKEREEIKEIEFLPQTLMFYFLYLYNPIMQIVNRKMQKRTNNCLLSFYKTGALIKFFFLTKIK